MPAGVSKLLANAHTALVGYPLVPDQTAVGQARMQFEEAGTTVERRLVSTRDGQTTRNRMRSEHGCLAVLVPNATGSPEDADAAVRGTVDVDCLARVVPGLFGGTLAEERLRTAERGHRGPRLVGDRHQSVLREVRQKPP
jgi:hypothetical protein